MKLPSCFSENYRPKLRKKGKVKIPIDWNVIVWKFISIVICLYILLCIIQQSAWGIYYTDRRHGNLQTDSAITLRSYDHIGNIFDWPNL